MRNATCGPREIKSARHKSTNYLVNVCRWKKTQYLSSFSKPGGYVQAMFTQTGYAGKMMLVDLSGF